MQCQICETSVSDRALFCEVCGNRVRRAPAAEPAPARTVSVARPAATQSKPAPTPPVVPREEVAAAIAARAELGERLEPEVLDTFVARIEAAVITRVDERIDAQLRKHGVRTKPPESPSLPVAICSLIFGIPLSAIAAGSSGLAGLAVAWLGIAAVNIAVNLRKRSD
jgi:hypothetical protein